MDPCADDLVEFRQRLPVLAQRSKVILSHSRIDRHFARRIHPGCDIGASLE